MKIGAIIQARVASTRLPGKVLKKLPYGSDVTVLQQVIRRLKISKKLEEIVIATTLNKEDEEIIKLAEKEGVRCFKGSANNLLERYYFAAKEINLDLVVRVTSDCPCIDANIVDFLIEEHFKTYADYTSNSLVNTYPHGVEAEVINFSALEKAYKYADKSFETEHVCPYIYETKSSEFKSFSVEAPSELIAPQIRITIDTEEDYALLCVVFDNLYYKREHFNTLDVITLFKEKPWLELINKKVVRKKNLVTLEEEISETLKILDLQELKRAKNFIKKHFCK